MKLIYIIISFIFFLSFMIMMIASTLSKKSFYDREKNSPFECGFDPIKMTRMSFSIRFFLIAVIFLIFDVEIALLLPMVLTLSLSNLKLWILTSSYFILILILGTMYEWKFGSLNWL
uniref:NADH-ubiquinone oxidoreductase chain 3 n=1 Tax=Cimbex luteus TaxID=1384799 RepID=A0A7T1C5B5_9HYME|nr:NADH dehydrogenase subunit 3 [Cimbex luteus]QPM99418.1 NADH dehydrogenase subunit 3 [Cimbex luteus]UXW64283.1 NADH dehydrogenase subunit 3 [Cimbex luteus]